MTYQAPTLFLVGAAQGLVLGLATTNPRTKDHVETSNCDLNVSRGSLRNC